MNSHSPRVKLIHDENGFGFIASDGTIYELNKPDKDLICFRYNNYSKLIAALTEIHDLDHAKVNSNACEDNHPFSVPIRIAHEVLKELGETI